MKQHGQRAGSNTAQIETAQEIARVAAKILAEEGINDYLLAKQRAIQRLHLPENTALPKNAVVQQCLASHLELFDKKGLNKRQTEFRKLAIQIMELIEDFQPLAVGSVVDGIITKSSRLQIHVFAPSPEHIATTLMDKNIPYQLAEQNIRFTTTKTESRPAYNFLIGDTSVNLCVFSEKERRKCPLSHINSRPTKRLGLISLKNTL